MAIPSYFKRLFREYVTGVGSSDVADQSPVQSVNSKTGDVTINVPVDSVNGETGTVTLSASDVNALADTYSAPVQSVNSQTGDVTVAAGGVIPSSQTVTSYSDLPLTDRSDAEMWFVSDENDIVASTQLSPVVWRSVSDYTLVASVIPDYQVDHRYLADDFASPWPDNDGSADMSVNGLTSSTFSNGETSVAGGGSSDHGLADGPQTYGGLSSWGIAFTVQASSAVGFASYTAQLDGSVTNQSRFSIRVDGDGADGNVGLTLEDTSGGSGARLRLYTSSATINDGTPHGVILNKSSDNASDVDIYIDDVQNGQEKSVTVLSDSFNSGDFSTSIKQAFFARNTESGVDQHTDMDAGVFEFKPTPYSESEREAFIDYRPEV